MVRKGIDTLDTPTSAEAISADRGTTHGDWLHQSQVEANIKLNLRSGANHVILPAGQAMALDAIAMKMSRIVTGDPKFADHWDDIAGYALLGKRK